MNIHYRIVKVEPAAHSVLVRYWTDKVSEMDLAGPINDDGTPKLNADGYPLGCRTDVLITLYDTPTPTQEELDKYIMMQAPIDWLRLQEDIQDSKVDTSMKAVRNLVGDTKQFNVDDINAARQELATKLANEANSNATEEQALTKAYEVIGNISDSIKVLAEKDPKILTALAAALNTVIKPT